MTAITDQPPIGSGRSGPGLTTVPDGDSRMVPRTKARYDQHSWRQGASCRDLDREMFFPTGTTGAAAEELQRAKAVCASCPVQASCLHFALTTNQEFGVWGGCDEEERHVLRREWRAAARA